MPRVKRGTIHVRRRKTLLKRAKGFRLGRRNTIKLGRKAVTRAGVDAFIGRKLKKRDRRANWNVRINAALELQGMSYSKFIDALKKKGIVLDRKVLSQVAASYPEVFVAIVKAVK